MDSLAKILEFVLPDGSNPSDMLMFLLFIIVAVIILAILIRMIHEAKSGYNHALASALALLFTYIVLLWLHDEFMTEYIGTALKILPLIDYDGTTVTLFHFSVETAEDVLKCCIECVYTLVLSFILIRVDDAIPDEKGPLAWMLMQVGIALATPFLYWIVDEIFKHFLPEGMHEFIPMILIAIVAFLAILAIAKVILNLLIISVNPLLGAVSTFFSKGKFGQALGKSVLCTFFLCLICIYLVNNGLDTFVLADMNLIVCGIPMVVIVCLWFFVGHVL